MQGTPLGWAALHRNHHKYCETELDIHSPENRKGIFSKFWYSHIGWMATHDYNGDLSTLADYPPDHPLRAMQQRVTLKMILLAHLLVSLVLLGPPGILVDFAARFTSLHAMLTINSVCHMFGQTANKRCKAGNVWFTFAFQLGDNWHMNHHESPRLATNQRRIYQVDLVYCVIVLLSLLGLVKNIKKKEARPRNV